MKNNYDSNNEVITGLQITLDQLIVGLIKNPK